MLRTVDDANQPIKKKRPPSIGEEVDRLQANENMDKGHRISIVDDDSSVRRALDRLLRSAGYLVDAHESAEAFLAAAIADETACLILDVHLPGRSGLQLQAELNAAAKRTPVIFITAFDDQQARTQAIDASAVDFFRKPLDSEKLLDAIGRALAEPTV